MSMHTNPFEILGLPVRRDLTDAQVDAAWRKIAVATHADRPDGGDLARYTQASAAFAELRVPWSRSEAYADVVEQTRNQGYDGLDDDGQPYTEPLHLALRAIIAAMLSLIVLQLIPGSPAAPADILGLIIWFVLTGRKDLAPP